MGKIKNTSARTAAPPHAWHGRKILVTGAAGFVGSNLVPLLKRTGCELITPSRRDCDLLDQAQVRRLLLDCAALKRRSGVPVAEQMSTIGG